MAQSAPRESPAPAVLVQLSFGSLKSPVAKLQRLLITARSHECEFLMCFALQVGSGELSVTSPYVEIGFSLPVPTDEDPAFVRTVGTAAGFPS